MRRSGEVTSRCKREGEGRFRLTFFRERRRVRLVVGSRGAALRQGPVRVPPSPPKAGG
jgi:hypothetical protein